MEPGTIIVPNSGSIRYAACAQALDRLTKPDGTLTSYPAGSLTKNLNETIRRLPSHHGWVWLMGDDHVFGNGLLLQLLEHDAPIVVPLCAKRSAPYRLVIGGETTVEK